MTASPARGRRPSPATVALALAALLAAAAVAVALSRSGGEEEAPAAANASAAAGQAPSVDAMVAGLAERLRRDPDNHEGWFLLGMTLRGAERFAEAGQAFRRAMELAPRNADYTAYLGEMLILAADGPPPPEAERLFRRALALQPGNPQARYYLATMRDLRGDHRGAIDDLLALLREAPAGAPWEPQVRGAAAAIARANDIDIAGRLPPPPPPAASTATAAIPGPTAEQMAAARAIPPGRQDEMVGAMVARLAARLRRSPRDADGWIMLMRSHMVLRDAPAARAALASGLAAFPGDAATQGRLREAAGILGVPAG